MGMNINIKTKILLINILASLIIIVAAWSIYFVQRVELKNRIDNALIDNNQAIVNVIEGFSAQKLSDMLSNEAKDTYSMVDSINQRVVDKELDLKDAKEIVLNYLKSKNRGNDGYFVVATPKENIIYHPNRDELFYSKNNHATLRFALNNHNNYYEYIWDKAPPHFNMKKSLYSIYYKPWNWVIILTSAKDSFKDLIDLKQLSLGINKIKIGKNGECLVLDSYGNVIIDNGKNEKNLFFKKTYDNKFIYKTICTKKNGKIEYLDYDSKEKMANEKIAFYSHVKSLDWIVVSTGYKNEFYEIVKFHKNFAIIISFAAFLYLLILNVFFNRLISNPIKRLLDAIEVILGKKNFDPIKINSNDEIGQLTRNFNNLILKLNRYSLNLEKLVEMKTDKLKETNDQLKTLNERLNKNNHELYISTITDYLTGVYNRSYLIGNLTQLFSRAKRNDKVFSILMIDLDNFKMVNDLHGHLKGDETLKTVSQSITKIVRREDSFGRYGGEEFLLLLPNTNASQSYHIAEKIRSMVEQLSFYNKEEPFSVTVSIGIASSDMISSNNPEDIIKFADKALYVSKNNGRNIVSIYEST